MKDCTNKRLRQKLFAYELVMLDDEERRELEEHLYECDTCYNDVEQFAGWAEYLRDEKQVRDSVLAGEHQHDKRNKKPIITRLLITVAAVLILSVPTYFYLFQPPDIDVTQRINLTPMRDLGSHVIDLGLGGVVEIAFVAEEARRGADYRVTITARDRTVIYQETFSDFSESRQGVLVFPVETFKAGFYSLAVIDPSGSPPVTIAEYTFRAE